MVLNISYAAADAKSPWFQQEKFKHENLIKVLRGDWFSLNGEVNLPAVLYKAFSGGKDLSTMPMQYFGKGTFLEDFFGNVGITANVFDAVNALYRAFAPEEEAWDVPMKTANKMSPRISLYLAGFPIATILEKNTVENTLEILKDEKNFAYEIKQGWFKSKVIPYTELEFYMHPKLQGISGG